MSEDRQVKTEQLAKSRIIIVDDEPIMLDMIETLLRDWRHEVTVLRFQNRDKAWQELLRCDPDLLITDMRSDNVPGRSGDYGMSGFELLKLLAERLVKYPVHGEFVIERPLSGDPAPLPPNPIPSNLLACEKRDCIAGAPAGRTGHSPGNWRNTGRSR
jgi:CheY-like chemotaxis protein